MTPRHAESSTLVNGEAQTTKEPPDQIRIMEAREQVAEMIWAYTKSQLVGIAAKLNIAGTLSAGPRHVADIAAEIGIGSEVLCRLLRGFELCGLVCHREDSRVEITELGAWLQPDVPGSLHTIALRTHDLYYPAWSALLPAIEGDRPAFNHAFGTNYFDYISGSLEHVRTFNALMSAMCVQGARAVLSAYDFSDVRHIVDVGGGEGTLLCEILKANTHLQGTLFDCPAIAESARNVVKAAGLAKRCAIVAGDFRASIPQLGDIYILKHVLHNWPDDCCARILKHCRSAVSPHGRLLIIERVIGKAWSSQDIRSDLHMLVLMNGAERGEPEFRALLAASGFRLSRSIRTQSRERILEAMPA
jgi:hypothetical protein